MIEIEVNKQHLVSTLQNRGLSTTQKIKAPIYMHTPEPGAQMVSKYDRRNMIDNTICDTEWKK